MLDLSLKLILKIAVSVPDSAMPQWKPAWHDLLKAAASDQAMIRFALRSVGAMRLWPQFQRALHMCNCLAFDEIVRRRRHPELEHNDLLDLLMRADGEPLTDNEARDQLFTIIGAGYATSATLANWAIERLVHTPNALSGVTAEARGSDERMPFLDAVLQETLRLRPPIVLVSRLTRQPLTLGEHHFPAETLIVPVIQSVHRQPDLYDDPESFRPERFLQQRPTTHGHIPFGGGPHRCLADRLAIFQAIVILATVLRSVDLAAVDPLRGTRPPESRAFTSPATAPPCAPVDLINTDAVRVRIAPLALRAAFLASVRAILIRSGWRFWRARTRRPACGACRSGAAASPARLSE